MRNTSFTLIVLSTLIVESTTQDSAHHSFSIIQEDGLSIAATSGGPKYSEPLFEYRELLHLKQDPSNIESLLYRPGQFTRGSDGNYYVIDAGNHRVAVFNEQGEYLRSFGSEGGGPGAYRQLRLQGLYDDVLHIQDVNMRRTTRVGLDGVVIELLTMPRPTMIDVPNRYRLSGDRQLLLTHINQMGGERDRQCAAATIVNAENDTLFHTTTEWVDIAVAGYLDSQPDARHGMLIYFPGYPCSAFSQQHGILLSDGRLPVIHQYDLFGNEVGRIELVLPHKSVPDRERRWIIDDLNRRIPQRSGVPREIIRLRRELLTIADPQGYWTEMYVDDSGFIWLSVVENRYHYDDSPSADMCDIFSPDGEYLGRTTLPSRFSKCIAVTGYMCVIHEDEETGEYDPTVYRIVPKVSELDYPN